MLPPTTINEENYNALQQRVAKLEALLAVEGTKIATPDNFTFADRWGSVIGLVSAVLALYWGVGFPSHPYQFGLGAALILFAYRSKRFKIPTQRVDWALPALNFMVFTLMTKLVIGSGVRAPFFWLEVPSLHFGASQDKWYSLLPKTSMTWEPSSLATWTIDFPLWQSVFSILTILAAIFRFQPFASLSLMVLILLAVPSLSEFSWRWVFPGLLLGGVSFYLQFKKEP